jgi:uncharacterized protein YdeI (YjbR/CyaY-like superfamily)
VTRLLPTTLFTARLRSMKPALPSVFFADKAAYEAWLEDAYARSARPDGLWIRFAKKSSGVKSLTYAEAVEVSLAWGFIDGQSKGVDEIYFDQRYTPRNPKSLWSKINREKIAALEAAGKMREPGAREVALAKADGRWDAAYDPPSRVAVPDDLLAALARAPEAQAFFERLDSTNRFSILHRLQVIKTAAGRAKTLARFVDMLTRGETLHPVPQPAAKKAVVAKKGAAKAPAAKKPTVEAPVAKKRAAATSSAKASSAKASSAKASSAKPSVAKRAASK